MEETVIRVACGHGAARVAFESGRSLVIPSAMLEEIPLAAGKRADPDSVTALVEKKAPAYCLKQVIEWQSRRDHAAAEMKRKLRMMGYPARAAEDALKQMEKCGAVSDLRCCESLIRRKKRIRGREGLMMEMRARGVDGETARAALEEELDPEEEAQSALRLAQGLLARGKDPDRVFLALRRRGYAYAEALRALNRAREETAPSSRDGRRL
ncbi:MAG: RecX family transcriptional regulator [Clostridia bacterium]|nr:RecX family transcriptional regulator [Clostridia bacterium]